MWIELHDTLPDNPKVYDLAEIIDMDSDAIVGKLVRLWTWALNNRPDGIIKGEKLIARTMCYTGDPQQIVAAMVDVRLLDVVSDGLYALHNWSKYTGKLVERRARDRQRKQPTQAKTPEGAETAERDTCDGRMTQQAALNDSVGNSAEIPRNFRDNSRATVPNRTEPNQSNKLLLFSKSSSPSVTGGGDDEDLKSDYSADFQYLMQRLRKRYAVHFGNTCTNEAAASILRQIKLLKCTDDDELFGLVDAVLELTAAYNPDSPVAYIRAVIEEWRYYSITNTHELARVQFAQDVVNGRISGDIKAARDELDKAARRKHEKITSAN